MAIIKNITIVFLTSFFLMGQSGIVPYHTRTGYLLTSPGAMGVGLYGYDNPALLTYLHQPDLMFIWSRESGEWNDFKHWGLFTAIPKIGFGMIHEENGIGSKNDYNLSFAFGDKRQSLGLGYEWHNADTTVLDYSNTIKVGYLLRPAKQVSTGLLGNFATSGGKREGIIDIGIRPLGNEKVTLFADYALQSGQKFKDGHWSTGLVVEPLPGVRLTGRYFDDKSFTFGLNLSLGRAGVISQAHFDDHQEYRYNTYGIRLGAYDRNIFRTLFENKKDYLKLELLGPLKYQRYALFDKSNTLAELISIMEAAKEDVTVAGIAINASGMEINPEMLWELREKLEDFKSAGKHLVIFIDNVNTVGYYFASVADKIVMDPLGMIDLRGLLMGRTYLKGTLEKIGIGFDEWRFFKYKSAMESFSREDMSDADREQRQELIDDAYQLIKTDVCKSRNMTPEKFDDLVNNNVFFLAKEALEKGLIDTLGRGDAVKEIVKGLEGKTKNLINPGMLAQYNLPFDNHWGEKPKIAIIYALGICAMDQGITARQLVKDVEAVTDDKNIKAVVFRVDSPGGDALASDIVAQALKKCREKKPVIVSQGLVAGSGGYWLSMYGDPIVASPITITGSIGVIGGWMYNQGLKEKLGLTTDHVKTGEHADLEFGAVLPFFGALVPDRNLTEEERSKMETEIKTLYKDFVTMVSKARNKDDKDIEAVAQGRVWTGIDGKEIGLVDTLGGLQTAITIAKQKAGIPKDQEVEIIELPKKALFNPDMFKPKFIGLDEHSRKTIDFVKFYLEHNGQPLPILPTEFMDLTIE